MMKLVLILVLAIMSIGCSEITVAETNETVPASQGDVKLRTKLWKSLIEDYERGINPDNPEVKFGIALITVDVNEDASTMDSNVWLRYIWQDSRLAWDENVFPVDVLRVEVSKIWNPDVTLYNSNDLFSTSTSCVETKALIYPSGEVLWVPPCRLNSICQTTLKVHPYGEQICSIKFGSWTYDGLILNLDFYNNKTFVDMTDFYELTEWKVLSTVGERHEKYYPCCKEPYLDLTFNVTLQRKPETHLKCET